jgi:hypothetical protein
VVLLVEVPLVAEVEDGAGVGSEVNGVGTSGIGFDSTLAINSFRPASDLLRSL